MTIRHISDETRFFLQHQNGRFRVWRHRDEHTLAACIRCNHTGPLPGLMSHTPGLALHTTVAGKSPSSPEDEQGESRDSSPVRRTGIPAMDRLERLDASNPTVLPTPHATGSSITNEVTLKIDLHSDSITKSICTQKQVSVAEELDKVIKEGYALMQPIRFETLLSKIQKEMSLCKMKEDLVKLPGKNSFLFNDDKAYQCRVGTSIFFGRIICNNSKKLFDR
ncbi:hypothetical protein TNCV_1031861 [Trichonephila clavipes]|nr:hypothetical protein TNCV_1031861 [Trichonephila clavipes]